MSVTISNYDSAGKVIGTMTLSREAYDMMAPHHPPHVVGFVDSETHFIKDGAAEERPISPVTRTGMTLENAPVGGELIIDQTRYEITDSVIELGFNLPGKYRLVIRTFPWLDYEEELIYAG